MRFAKSILSLIFTTGVFLFPSQKSFAQINQFGGPNRNGIFPETGLMDNWPAEGPVLVQTITGIGEGFASPTITQNGIYIAGMIDSLGYVFHFDNNFQLKWKAEIGREFTFKYVGARGTPTIEDNRLYYVASMGNAACLNAITGEKIWELNIFERFNGVAIKWGYAESPLIYGDKIFFTPGGKGSNFVALNKTNGNLIWAADIDSTYNAYCSPVIVNHNKKDLILLNSSYCILLIDPDNGNVLVRHPLTQSSFNHALPPLYIDGKLLYSSGYGEGATLFQIVDGKTLLDTIYTNSEFDCKLSGLHVIDGTVFGVSDKRKQWMGMDINSGKTLFNTREIKPGSFILADNKFYMFSDVGEVALSVPSKTEFKIVSQFQIPIGNVTLAFAHPVISNGILYIRYNNNMWLYKIK